MQEEAAYVCSACGEEIVVPIDVSQGAVQEYVEDCPVCCRPHLLRVQVARDGRAHVTAEAE
jgi:DNA-directed RNA polymerase subunit RPC12/RpoP